MASLVSGARVTALSAMIVGVYCQVAQAADMPFFTPPAAPLNEGLVEFGTGWYLRGDIAAARAPVLHIDGAKVAADFPNGWAAGLGFGYQYNNWFRTDVTADYEGLFNRSGPEFAIVPCQIGAATGCLAFFEGRATTAAFLANAYLDLGNWWGFIPYVGAGAGADVLFQNAQVDLFQGNGVPLALAGGAVSNASPRFAFAFMGGVSYDVTNHFKLDVGYRWLDLGNITGAELLGVPVKRRLEVQQLRVGLRYMID